MIQAKRQSGISLIELMISMVLGIFVVGGVLTVYLGVSKSSADTLKQSRLNAEVSAIMNIMANDIRRAGYWELNTDQSVDGFGNETFSAAELELYAPQDNPFNQFGSTELHVRDAASNASAMPTSASYVADNTADCILYVYDANRDGDLDSEDGFGFRINGTGIDMRVTSTTDPTTDCTIAGEWQGMVDTSLIEITNLEFDVSASQCVNATEPDDVDDGGIAGTVDDAFEINCYDTGTATEWADPTVAAGTTAGDATTEIREVKITLEARLLNDTLVSVSMEQTVRVRNDLIRVR